MLRNQMYVIELRHLSSIQQEVVGLWLDMIRDNETIPGEDCFFERHFSLADRNFRHGSPFEAYMKNLLVLKCETDGEANDWRYLYRGEVIRRAIYDDAARKPVARVSDVENPAIRKLILDDFEVLTKVQSPHHPRLIWRPYSGYFGPEHEHKTFVRIGMPLGSSHGAVSSCIFLVMEARFDGRAIIELS